ncbi:hypothetical protein BBJ28_00026782 [Nothophytophthora sp. Chile5]|nr:hypothetical protein BBJ28_00026782 [Nothophytophthora sp. Chile5]
MRDVGLGTTLPREAEALPIKWVNDYRRDGVPISALMLQLKAEEVARGFGIPSGRFLVPGDGDAASRNATASFAKAVAARAVAEGITVIYNADQTGVTFELLPRTTLSPTGSKTVWIKCGKKEKERMTAMSLGDSTGRKYPLFLVMKTAPSKKVETRAENAAKRHGFGKHLWHQLELLQEEHNVRIYGNQSTWWTGGLTVEFLRYHFGHRDVFSEPVMLLLDDFSGHWVSEHLRRQLDAHRDGAGDQPFSMAPPCRATIAKWVSNAWDDISESVIRTGFHKCKLHPDDSDGSAEIEETLEL